MSNICDKCGKIKEVSEMPDEYFYDAFEGSRCPKCGAKPLFTVLSEEGNEIHLIEYNPDNGDKSDELICKKCLWSFKNETTGPIMWGPATGE